MAKGINIIKYILLVCVFSFHFGVYDSIAQQTPRYDYVSDLYDALIESGNYDASELAGSKEGFRKAMASKDMRKAFYDWIVSNEDFDIGPYYTYEVDLASSYDTEVLIRETPNQEKYKTTEEAMGAVSKAYLYTFLKYFAALCFICLFIWGIRNLHRRFFPSRTKEAITAKKRSNNKGESTLAPIGAETSRLFTTLRSKTTAICNMKKIITILLAVYLCALGFLFAINGRYTALGEIDGNNLVFDKWSKKVLGGHTWYETKDYEKK